MGKKDTVSPYGRIDFIRSPIRPIRLYGIDASHPHIPATELAGRVPGGIRRFRRRRADPRDRPGARALPRGLPYGRRSVPLAGSGGTDPRGMAAPPPPTP